MNIKVITKKQDANQFNILHWICLAITKDKARYNMDGLCIRGGIVFGTCGRTLAYADREILPIIKELESDNCYKVIKLTQTEIQIDIDWNTTPPNAEQVIPRGKYIVLDACKEFMKAKIYQEAYGKAVFDPHILENCLPDITSIPKEIKVIEDRDSLDAFSWKSENMGFVAMPLRDVKR